MNTRGVPESFRIFTPPDSNSIQYYPDKITQAELHSGSISSLSISAGASFQWVEAVRLSMSYGLTSFTVTPQGSRSVGRSHSVVQVAEDEYMQTATFVSAEDECGAMATRVLTTKVLPR